MGVCYNIKKEKPKSEKTLKDSKTFENQNPIPNENNPTSPDLDIEISDDGSIKNLKDELTLYDLIIYCNSLENIKNGEGWYYKISKNYEKEKFNEKEVTCIGIIGDTNAGKSYFLAKLVNLENIDKFAGIDIKTEGLSCKYHQFKKNDENWYLLFDTEGNSEALVSNNNEEIRKLNPSEAIQKISEKADNMKKFEKFLSKFIINNSSIIIYILNFLTLESQKIINDLKLEEFSKIFIIHNLKNFYDKTSIENYIDNTLRKSVPNNLKKIYYNDFNEDGNLENQSYYFVEPVKDSEKQIIHLIMGNDENNENNKIVKQFFNEKTFEYIRKNITTVSEKKNFNIIQKIKEELGSEFNIKNINFIKDKYKDYFGKIYLNIKFDNNKSILKNNDLFLNTCKYSYFLVDNKFLQIIFEAPGKEDKNLKVNYKEVRGKYKFTIEGIQESHENNKKKEKKFFLITCEIIKKKLNIRLKENNNKKITFNK